MNAPQQAGSGQRRHFGYALRELSIASVLADKAATIGDKIYLTDLGNGRSYSYRDVHLVSNRLANGLLALGIGPGDHVAVMMENRAEHLFLHFALGKVGAVAVPINTAARGSLLGYLLAQSDATVLIIERAFIERFHELRADLPNIRRVVVYAEDGEAPAAAGIDPAISDFGQLEHVSDSTPDIPVGFSDPAFIFFTSGTTGPSKGVLFCHARSLLWEWAGFEAIHLSADDIYFVCLPLFHVSGLLCGCYSMAAAGASVVLARRFSASRYWSDVRRTGTTITNLMGSMANILWAQAPTPQDMDNAVRVLQTVPYPKFGAEFEQRFGVRITSGYGLTDYGTPTTFAMDDPLSKRGSAGRLREAWQVRILDDDDLPLPAREVGEIALLNPEPWHASTGYYKMPEATLASRRNGWFHTGDRGYLDEDGFLWFVDRKKDAIRRRGENISAFEVERVILDHPAVADVAVYALASEMAEDEVAASIVLRDGAVASEAEIVAHCQRNMAYFMVPRLLQFVADLPRNPSQKVEKYKLKQAAENNRSLMWDREQAGIVLQR